MQGIYLFLIRQTYNSNFAGKQNILLVSANYRIACHLHLVTFIPHPFTSSIFTTIFPSSDFAKMQEHHQLFVVVPAYALALLSAPSRLSR